MSFFKKIFTKKINSITVAATLVAFSSLISRFLGIFRDRILAGQFGAGDTLDIYYAAFRVPDLIFNLLVLGALSAGFIPILTGLVKDFQCEGCTDYEDSPNKKAWELVSNILNVLIAGLAVITVLGIIFAPYLMKAVAPGFSPEKQMVTANITRIMFLSPLFLGISSVLGGILQSFRRFFVYSLAPILYNLGIIAGALLFAPHWGVYGLAWGVVMGAFLHMFIQVPLAFKLGFRYRPIFNLADKNLKKIGRMMVPRTMTLGISQLNLLVMTIIASGLTAGSLTVFNFANNLHSFPAGIFGISFAIAAFPTMSAVAFNKKKLIANFSYTVRQILFFIVPATVLLLTLRAQIVRVVFGTGRFDWQDTIATIDTLSYFAIGLFAQALIPLLIRVFYARHNSKTPFFIGLVSAGVNLISAIWLSGLWGVAGLGLAFSLAGIVNFVLLWLALYIEFKGMDEIRILISTVKFSAAGVMCGIVVQATKSAVWPFIDMSRFWGIFTQGAVAGICGIVVYLLICYILRSEELFTLWSLIKKKAPWKKARTGDQGEARGI
jgi:putative peptidoglycan lipid II flippase